MSLPTAVPPSPADASPADPSPGPAGPRSRRRLNLGIVAHVDAGKTSLTERVLFETGVIDHVGGVDSGDTQTDTDDIERERGITIRSAVVSFALGDVDVNLVDTPGHADFIAEVERALRILDGAVLVISAVEGVQAQTRLLMRTLRAMRIPTLLFVNKIDRTGARLTGLVDDIRTALTDRVVLMSAVTDLGTTAAEARTRPLGDTAFVDELTEVVATDDETVLTRWLDSPADVTDDDRRTLLADRVRAVAAHPVFAGSAITGAGVRELLDGIHTFLAPPAGLAADSDPDVDALRAAVFKIVRNSAGEKLAYVRLHAGSIAVRQHVPLFRRVAGRVDRLDELITSVQVLVRGSHTDTRAAGPGEIALVGGLRSARIGDQLGTPDGLVDLGRLSTPGLETVVTPIDADRTKVHDALAAMAEQDPLIDLRVGAEGELAVSLYGEVQKEVLREQLLRDYGVRAEFSRTRTVFIERIDGTGTAAEEIWSSGFPAGVGLRVGPAPVGSGLVYRLEVELGALLLSFHTAIEETVRTSLEQGLAGWRIPDAEVVVTATAYNSVMSTAGHFRQLTPLVLFAALAEAGTTVCEPMSRFDLTGPAAAISVLMRALGDAEAGIGAPEVGTTTLRLVGELPTERVHGLTQLLPGLTSGQGLLSTTPGGYRPLRHGRPTRTRTDGNPLDRVEYLRHLHQRT
ncbi:MAG TPA: translation factor GTPase family protein [Actinopolymorphaceae bacterium]|jgi:ribosomal protection tetracycline resistance protein